MPYLTLAKPRALPPVLELGEKVLRQLRESIRGTAFADKISAQFERTGNAQPLSTLKLQGEGRWGWEEFYDRYTTTDRVPTPWFRLSTEDRLGFGHNVERMLESLRGLPISVTADNAWRWDSALRSPNGGSTYIPTYGLFISLSESSVTHESFNPDTLIQRFQKNHCMSQDPRADIHLFDYTADNEAQSMSTYNWSPTGFVGHTHTKEAAEKLAAELFADCICVISRNGLAKDKNGWLLAVGFPN